MQIEDLKNCVYLDTETTGLDDDANVIEIAIVDCDGNELVNTLINPPEMIPEEATAIHGITDSMVSKAPLLSDVYEKIIEAVKGKTLVIYNAEYDLKYLKEMVHAPKEIYCCMSKYAEYRGEKGYRGDWRWQKLINAAADCGYVMRGTHRALEDSLACRAVWEFMVKDGKPHCGPYLDELAWKDYRKDIEVIEDYFDLALTGLIARKQESGAVINMSGVEELVKTKEKIVERIEASLKFKLYDNENIDRFNSFENHRYVVSMRGRFGSPDSVSLEDIPF